MNGKSLLTSWRKKKEKTRWRKKKKEKEKKKKKQFVRFPARVLNSRPSRFPIQSVYQRIKRVCV